MPTLIKPGSFLARAAVKSKEHRVEDFQFRRGWESAVGTYPQPPLPSEGEEVREAIEEFHGVLERARQLHDKLSKMRARNIWPRRF